MEQVVLRGGKRRYGEARTVAKVVTNGRKRWQTLASLEARVLGSCLQVSSPETVAGAPRTRVRPDSWRIEEGAVPRSEKWRKFMTEKLRIRIFPDSIFVFPLRPKAFRGVVLSAFRWPETSATIRGTKKRKWSFWKFIVENFRIWSFRAPSPAGRWGEHSEWQT